MKGRACGKFILLGEHFIVGAPKVSVPALAFPLEELWCEVRLDATEHPRYKVNLPVGSNNWDVEVIESLMARATYAVASSFRIDVSVQHLHVESYTNFPVSRGFGSSAAFAVALARAFDEYRKSLLDQDSRQNANWDELVKATSAAEKIFHGQPSGVDAATILAGRPIRFENGKILRELTNNAVDFVAVDSGDRDHCASLIKWVSTFREQNNAQWERMASVMRILVDECERSLNSGNAAEVGRIVREAQGILAELGLSTPSIDHIIGEARGFGAFSGKVSGAGGGGAVLLVANKGEGRDLARSMTRAGRQVVAISSGDVIRGNHE